MLLTTEPIPAVLARQGFTAGAPESVTAETVQIDADAAARMRCGNCRKRGLTFQPLNRNGAYRAVAACPRCRFVEEV